MLLTAVVLVAVGAGAIFWAGMTLGGATSGRNASERAAIEAFTRTYQDIADRFIGSPVPEEVLGGALEGMFTALDDPYSAYMPPDAYDAALDDVRGEFEGVGAEMNTTDAEGVDCEVIDEDCRLRVVRVFAGAPAETAGLRAGDSIVAVDAEPIAGRTIDDLIWRIRGPRGSEVVLTVERGGTELELPITRDRIAIDDVHSSTLAEGRVGYIAIDNFSSTAAEDFETALRAHLDAGVDGLVVDVRDDPGGFVEATVDITSQFIDEGAVFWEEYADGSLVAVDVSGDGIATDPGLQVALLVNGGSASASEILGGALQDSGRAVLVGEPTFGKGTVQEWNELPGENGGYRLSVAKWLTRDKSWIDGDGLAPDVPVALTGERYQAAATDAVPAADEQLMAAVSLLLDETSVSSSPGPTATSEPLTEPAA